MKKPTDLVLEHIETMVEVVPSWARGDIVAVLRETARAIALILTREMNLDPDDLVKPSPETQAIISDLVKQSLREW